MDYPTPPPVRVESLNDPPPLEKPTTADVAALLRARTKDLDGTEVGDFNTNTRPTGAEVLRLIDMAYNEITARTGSALQPRCAGLAWMLVVIRAAMWIESSYWPEQVRSDRSIYTELATQWTDGLVTLDSCVAGNLPGTDEGGGDASTYRWGMINVHGWTESGAPWAIPEAEPVPEVEPYFPEAVRRGP
jgi:hypothetical protein